VNFGTVSAGDDIRISASNATIGTANTSGTGEDEEGAGSDFVVEAPGGSASPMPMSPTTSASARSAAESSAPAR
jgi:hypothetical protein